MIKPSTPAAYQLLHEGTIALAQVEANGIRIDVDYLDVSIRKTSKKIKSLYEDLYQDKMYKKWKKHFGTKTNLGSRPQLGTMLFDVMGLEAQTTEKGRYKTDAEVLERLHNPFVDKLLKIEKLKKANNTYLKGIRKEVMNGFLHPMFSLNTVETFRSSSQKPNFQNIPIRDPAVGRLIRRAFIPRPGHVIVETDYGGAEIRGAACYHKDKKMMDYIKDPQLDMHRDMAQQCFKLPRKQVSKMVRYCGKNMFVFPQFYGDWYMSCAQSLWGAISQLDLKTNDGVGLYEHLASKGIKKLGACKPDEDPRPRTFEHHIKEVEKDFWQVRFRDYDKWKKKWYDAYVDKGYFKTLTGFVISGEYNRKQVINYPIQGTAFHWLLWSLIRINKILRKKKMKSVIIGQIHDSIVADVHKKELKEYLEIVEKVMTKDVRKHWPWIIVPLEVENEITPLEGTWNDKTEVTTLHPGYAFDCPECRKQRKFKTVPGLLRGLSNKKCKKCAV